MRLRTPLVLTTLAATAVVGGVGFTSAAAVADSPVPTASAAATKSVFLRNIAFSPTTTRAKKGDKIRFVFSDNGVTHNVVATGSKKLRFGKSTRTPQLKSGSRTTAALKTAGTYSYICSVHPAQMKGRIVVR